MSSGMLMCKLWHTIDSSQHAKQDYTNQTEVHDISILCAKAFGMDKLRDNFMVYFHKASFQRGYRSENQSSIKQPINMKVISDPYPKQANRWWLAPRKLP